MVLKDLDSTNVWDTQSDTTGARRAELLNTGFLVLKYQKDVTVWQNLDFPTDTLLSFQTLTKKKS